MLLACWTLQEVWTLCRILKRNTSNRKCIPDWREISNTTTTRNRTNPVVDAASSKTCSVESDNRQAYNICFRTTPVTKHLHDDLKKKKKPVLVSSDLHVNIGSNNLVMAPGLASIYQAPSSGITSYSNFSSPEVNELPQYGNWDELRSIVEFAGGDTFFSYWTDGINTIWSWLCNIRCHIYIYMRLFLVTYFLLICLECRRRHDFNSINYKRF